MIPHVHRIFRIIALFAVLAFFACGCLLTIPYLGGWRCQSDNDCIEPLICNKNLCTLSCQSSTDCKEAQEICQNGFCLKGASDASDPDQPVCIPSAEICDGKDNNCDGQIDENLQCASEGQECDPFARNPIGCKKDLECATFYPDRPRICLRPCARNDPSSCKDARYTCLPTPSQRYACLQTGCQAEKDCDYNSQIPHECVSVGGSTRYCLPLYPASGKLSFGQICSPTDREYCFSSGENGIRCMRTKAASKGFCTKRCSDGASCQNTSPASACELLEENSNTKVCTFRCPNGDSDCPSGMTCNRTLSLCTVSP